MTVLEAELYLGRTDKTVRGMIARGELRGFKVGRRWWVTLPEKFYVHLPFTEPEAFCFLRGTEVAQLLEITPRAVRKMAKDGRLEFEWIGKKRGYSVAAARKALAARLSGEKRPATRRSSQVIVEWARRRLLGDPLVASAFDEAPRGR